MRHPYGIQIKRMGNRYGMHMSGEVKDVPGKRKWKNVENAVRSRYNRAKSWESLTTREKHEHYSKIIGNREIHESHMEIMQNIEFLLICRHSTKFSKF